jgi:hypothetical protein
MVHGRNGYRRSSHFMTAFDELLDTAERAAVEFFGYSVGALEILIDNADQPDGCAAALF